MRKYKSGSRWAFWRWTDVDSEYIRRLHILKTPWFAVCLHWINKPDPEPYLHDHPVTFLSLVLRGWYTEERAKVSECQRWARFWNTARWFNWIRASDQDRHTIKYVAPEGALTLCFMGPKTREWGFHTENGWVWWKDYYRAQRSGVQL